MALETTRARDVPVIAIDGPAASGKGTIAYEVAQTLGFHYLDSGSLYRVVALRAIGSAVKRAVVTAIIWVVVADAALSAFFQWARY